MPRLASFIVLAIGNLFAVQVKIKRVQRERGMFSDEYLTQNLVSEILRIGCVAFVLLNKKAFQ